MTARAPCRLTNFPNPKKNLFRTEFTYFRWSPVAWNWKKKLRELPFEIFHDRRCRFNAEDFLIKGDTKKYELMAGGIPLNRFLPASSSAFESHHTTSSGSPNSKRRRCDDRWLNFYSNKPLRHSGGEVECELPGRTFMRDGASFHFSF